MEVDIVKIMNSDKREIDAAAEVLGKSFAGQPSSLTIYRDSRNVEKSIGLVFKATLLKMPGEIYVAKHNGKTVGAMRIVRWPDCQMRPGQGLQMLPYLIRSGGLGTMKRAMAMRGTWAQKDPKEPHWHLDPIGVLPDLQGNGIGSQMMSFYCHLIDQDGIAAYHETDRAENVPFYEKFGYRVVEEGQILDFTVWYMGRDSNRQ